MNPRRLLLTICALCIHVLLLPPSARASGSCNRESPNLDAAIGSAGDTQSSTLAALAPALQAGAGQVERIGSGLRALDRADQALCQCAGVQSQQALCIYRALGPQFFCDVYAASGLPDFGNPFGLTDSDFLQQAYKESSYYQSSVLSVERACEKHLTGTPFPTLICCQDPGMMGCKSPLPPPEGIACVGPSGTGKYYGPVMRDTNRRLRCDQYPECDLNGQASGDAEAALQRFFNLYHALAEDYADHMYGDRAHSLDSPCNLDLATFAGCKGWLDHVDTGRPFALLRRDEALPNGSEALRLQRELAGTAALRVMFAVPNGLVRYEYAMSQTWSTAQKRSHLGSIDAEQALLEWLSPCALEMLQAALPGLWEFFAVPAPVEPAPALFAEPGMVDSCWPGEAPRELTLAVANTAAGSTVSVSVVDPEGKAGQAVPLMIDWGDDQVDGVPFLIGSNANNYTHQYAVAGPFEAKVTYTNSAGLTVFQHVGVDPVPVASAPVASFITGLKVPASMVGVTVPLTRPRGGDRLDAVVHLFVEDADRELHLVRSDYVGAESAARHSVAGAEVASIPVPVNAAAIVWKVQQPGVVTGGDYEIASVSVVDYQSTGSATERVVTLGPNTIVALRGSVSMSSNVAVLDMFDGAHYRLQLPP